MHQEPSSKTPKGKSIKTNKRKHNGPLKKGKQRSTKHHTKTKDRATGTTLKPGGDLRCTERISCSCSINATCCVTLVTNPVINHKYRKKSECDYDKWDKDTDTP